MKTRNSWLLVLVAVIVSVIAGSAQVPVRILMGEESRSTSMIVPTGLVFRSSAVVSLGVAGDFTVVITRALPKEEARTAGLPYYSREVRSYDLAHQDRNGSFAYLKGSVKKTLTEDPVTHKVTEDNVDIPPVDSEGIMLNLKIVGTLVGKTSKFRSLTKGDLLLRVSNEENPKPRTYTTAWKASDGRNLTHSVVIPPKVETGVSICIHDMGGNKERYPKEVELQGHWFEPDPDPAVY